MDTSDVRAFLESYDERDWQASSASAGPVRFAVVGLGWWTRDEAIPAIEASTFCRVTVAVSGSAEKANEVADAHDTIRHGLTYEQFHDGVAADAYDAVYVCTPNALHLDHVEAAAAHGKAVLCEKPMEADVERSRALVDACEDADVTAMIAYRMHTEPTVRRARELIREGAIGRPVHVHGDMSQRIVGWGEDQWRLDPELAGYGASVMDLGIYPLNTTRFLLDRDPVAVESMMHSDHDLFADVPDEVAAFTVAFEDGVYAACTASQNAAQTSHLEVVGTEGSVRIEPAFHLESELRVTVDGATMAVETAGVDQMEAEFDYFADCLLSGREPYATPEHGLVDVETIAAIHEAADRGERVRL